MVGRVALLVVAMLCACGTPEKQLEIYNPVAGGAQTFTLESYAQDIVAPSPPFYVVSTSPVITRLEGAACRLRNDKGSWTVTTPGKVAVAIGGTLHIECTREGYKPTSASLPCTNPKVRGATEGAMTVLTILGPVGIVGAAIAAPGLLVGAVAAGATAGGEASAKAAGPEGNEAGCDYQYTSLNVRFHRVG